MMNVTGRPLCLDLYCCAGGTSRGYQMGGFYVVGVDIQPQKNYIGDDFLQADALEVLRILIGGGCIIGRKGRVYHLEDFSLIAASPPCQAYTGMRRITIARFGSAPDHPDLIEPTRELLKLSGKPYIIENVQGSPLQTQVILCGASFGLSHLARHRHFESNLMILGAPPCSHRGNEYTIGVYGERPDGRRVSYRHHRLGRIASSIDEAREAMGINWMEWDEIKEAIPPVFTRWLSEQIIKQL